MTHDTRFRCVALLPLFPLGTVLVPGMILSLNVFEPRYRMMLRDLADREPADRAFGVLAIQAGHEVGAGAVQAMARVGTLAVITHARSRGGGSFFLQTLGTRRFRLLRTLDDDTTPYTRGEVDLLDEPDEDLDAAPVPDLTNTVSASFCALLEACEITLLELPADPRELSYFVTANSPLALAQRQRLLEVDGTEARLRSALDLLRDERRLRARFGVTTRDGPLPPAGVN